MRRRLQSESGWTLIELLVAMSLMLVVMGATLTTVDNGNANRRLNDERNDSVERARSSIDNIVRQLRNLASPSSALPAAIDRATATDLTFRTFDPNKRLVRYCLETDNSGNLLTTSANLIQMVSTNDAPGDYTHCTLSATTTPNWSRRRVAAPNVVNHRGTQNVEIFSYDGSTSNTPTIKNVRLNLLVDINAANKSPSQVRLGSGVALRNQNQPPTATFFVTNPSPRRYILNATASSDPETRNLIYTWYAAPTASFTPSSSNQIGFGPVLDYTFSTGGSNYYFKLTVSDSNLTDVCPTSAGVSTNCSTAGPKTF